MKQKILACLLFSILPIINLQADVPPPPGPPQQGQGMPGQGSGSDTFGALVQQNTSTALATFQGVDYKTLSGNQDQNYFFNSDDSSDSTNLATLIQKFKLAPEN